MLPFYEEDDISNGYHRYTLVPTATQTTYEEITNTLWDRLRAFIVDSLIVSLIVTLLLPVFGVPYANDNGTLFFSQSTLVTIAHVGVITLRVSWSYLVLFAYYFIQEWLFGTTLGKRWFGLDVVAFAGSPLTWWRALLRNLIRPLDYGFFLIGFLLVRFDRFHQRVGDKWAGTIVVRRESLLEPPVSARQARSRLKLVLPLIVLFVIGCFAFMYYGRPPLVIAGMYNQQLAPFSPAPPRSGTPYTSSCITGYTLGTPTRQANTITYPVTYHIDDGHAPDQTGVIELRWDGFFAGGWQPGFSEGLSGCPS